MKSELYEKYKKEVRNQLKEKFNIENPMQIPTIKKIIVNSGIGKEYRTNTGVVEEMSEVLKKITGQKPVIVNSKIAISNFALRKGTPNGLKVTLRKDKMWDFLYKLIQITLPRVKDFRGVSLKSFDGKGNYSLGIKEHTIFPEIDTSTLSKIRPLQIVIVTESGSDKLSEEMLRILGMPFERTK